MNNVTPRARFARTFLTVLVVICVVSTAGARASTPPIKEIEFSNFGWEVDEATKARICTIESGHKCRHANPSSEPGGFEYPGSVATSGTGGIFIVDRGNHRVQELAADGTFVLMFGKEVNRKGGAGANICTKAEESECKSGVASSGLGVFGDGLESIAIDPTSGNLYVAEGVVGGGERVQELTPTGQFVAEIGREVNETKDKDAGATPEEKNVCTEAEIESSGVKCAVPVAGASAVAGSFNFLQGAGDLLAVDSKHVLYVGDEHRIQRFDGETDTLLGGIPVPRSVAAIASDASGDIFAVEGPLSTNIRVFDPTGKELQNLVQSARIVSLAVDSADHLAVSEIVFPGPFVRGTLYQATVESGKASLHPITLFASHGAGDLTFNSQKELYGAFAGETSLDPARHEIIRYRPLPVGEPAATIAKCIPGATHETNISLDCELVGTIDPWGVPKTSVWFQWGKTGAFGEETLPHIGVPVSKAEGEEEAPAGVSAVIKDVRPDQGIFDRLVGEDENAMAPEILTSSVVQFTTSIVPPEVVGAPTASFVGPSTAVLFGELNPENTDTAYEFQYAPEAECDQQRLSEGQSLDVACPNILKTSTVHSAAYGRIGAAQEVTSLQPATSYRYRLYARNQNGEPAKSETGGVLLPEGTFSTLPSPFVVAETGEAISLTPTSATITGSVNPDGQPSSYSFETGIYRGADTRYATVYSGSAGESATLTPETVALTGLQPATTYAYRITIHYGDGTIPNSSAVGATRTFTTQGLADVLRAEQPLEQLSVGLHDFPKEPQLLRKCAKGYRRNGHGKCAKVKRHRGVARRHKASRVKRSGNPFQNLRKGK